MRVNKKIMTAFFFSLIALLLLYRLVEIPASLFCDEVLTALRSQQLLHGDTSGWYNPFFYRHFGGIIGTAPVILGSPFIFLFGLTEFAVRLFNIFFAFLSLIILYKILRKLHASYTYLTIIMFVLTPLFFHLSRINFVQTTSLFFIMLALYFFYDSYNMKHEATKLALSGLFFGISLYGYLGYILSVPLFVSVLILTKLVFNRFNFSKCKGIFILFFVFCMCFLPILYNAKYNPDFLHRLKEKNAGDINLFSKTRIVRMIKNYPKYYSIDYLFIKGENDIPGAFISRHTVSKNGIFLKSFLPILLIGYLLFLFFPNKNKEQYAPFFILFFLYPFPDIISTRDSSAPYSVTNFVNIFFVPFIISYVLSYVPHKHAILSAHIISKGKQLLIIVLTFFVVCEGIYFFKTYNEYRLTSASYWGWQSGPKEMIRYFIDVKDQYDEIYMTGMFNEPQVFFDFYDKDKLCKKCYIGGKDQLIRAKKQLFALTTEEYQSQNSAHFLIKKILYYPDGTASFYIGEFL